MWGGLKKSFLRGLNFEQLLVYVVTHYLIYTSLSFKSHLGGPVTAKFEYTAYSKLAAAKISNISIYGFTYVTSNIHGHFVAEYRI